METEIEPKWFLFVLFHLPVLDLGPDRLWDYGGSQTWN